MKNLLIAFCLLLIANCANSQLVRLFGDTVKIYSGKAQGNEILLQNSTRTTKGFLFNYDGLGNTRFQRPTQLNDTSIIIGIDTFKIHSAETDAIALSKVITLNAGYGIIIPQTAGQVLNTPPSWTPKIDSTLISTRLWRDKLADSLGAIIATKGTGTITSVATGLGLSGGTITTTGTLILDTASPVVLSRQRAVVTYEPIITAPYTTNKYWNAYKQFVTLNTDSITEGATNKFYTDARARAALSLTTTGTSGAATYSNTTGVFNIPQYSGGTAISALTAAAATNTINNADYLQEWQWNTLTVGSGLKLSSSSTTAASNAQTLFVDSLYGANGTSAQTTYAAKFLNSHTGTTSTNVAGYFSASGGTTANYAIVVPSTGGNVGIGTVTPTAKLSLVAGTIATGGNAFNMTATMPTVLSGATIANLWSITGAGSSNQGSYAMAVKYINGYSGANYNTALDVENNNVSTGNNLQWGATVTQFLGNTGISSFVYGSTTGLNAGVQGDVIGGILNIGVIGKAIQNKASTTNIGVIGQGNNINATSPIEIGGYFTLGITAPTYVSAALIADNAAEAQPIFLARDAGVTVFTIADGGALSSGTTSIATASAQLDVVSTTKGFLPPRMTTTQRDAISSPATGLEIFNTTLGKHQGWDGSAWQSFY
jgi:hypothetical protein